MDGLLLDGQHGIRIFYLRKGANRLERIYLRKRFGRAQLLVSRLDSDLFCAVFGHFRLPKRRQRLYNVLLRLVGVQPSRPPLDGWL